MHNRNSKIKSIAKENGVYLWQIAERMGICEMTLTRLLRSKIAPAKESEILAAIETLAHEGRCINGSN